jgi:hypothetical protein
VAGVALGVVAEDRLQRATALLAHPGGGAREGDGDVRGVLGAVQLGVNQAAVVVLDGDHDRVPQPAGAAVLIALARHAMPRREELRRLVGVDVQQRARLAPLKAPEGLAAAAAPTRHAVALEDLPHCRTVTANQHGKPHGPPVRPGAGIEDAPLLNRTERPRARPWDRPARRTPRTAGPLGHRRPLEAIARRRHRRRRTAHRTSDPTRRLASENTRDHLALGARSEPAPTVCHVSGPPGGR